MVKVSKLHLDKKGMNALLSPLETETLLLLWQLEQAKVRELHKRISKKRKVALTSVAVILDRLHQKGMVERTVEQGIGGGHYIYSPKEKKEAFEESIIEHTVDKLMNNFGDVAANYFYKRFSRRNEE